MWKQTSGSNLPASWPALSPSCSLHRLPVLRTNSCSHLWWWQSRESMLVREEVGGGPGAGGQGNDRQDTKKQTVDDRPVVSCVPPAPPRSRSPWKDLMSALDNKETNMADIMSFHLERVSEVHSLPAEQPPAHSHPAHDPGFFAHRCG